MEDVDAKWGAVIGRKALVSTVMGGVWVGLLMVSMGAGDAAVGGWCESTAIEGYSRQIGRKYWREGCHTGARYGSAVDGGYKSWSGHF